MSFEESIASVKAGGVAALKSSGLLAQLEADLADTGKKAGPKRQAAVEAIASLVEAGKPVQPYLAELLASVLTACGDKVKPVANAADETAQTIVKSLDPHAVKSLVPSLVEKLDTGDNKAGTVYSALEVIRELLKKSANQVLAENAAFIPLLADLVNDINGDVEDAARSLVAEITELIENHDVEPLLPALLEAMIDPEEQTIETVHKLAGTTFAQVVDAPTYAIVLPVLLRGFGESQQAIKRQCAVVVDNMVKLALEPCDATPFLPECIPALTRCVESEVSDPEARKVCERALAALQRLKAKTEEPTSKKLANVDLLLPELLKATGDVDEFYGFATRYVAATACSIADANEYDEAVWTEALESHIAAWGVKDAAAAVKALHTYCSLNFKAQEVVDEDDDDAEILCDCKFTLAYGNKILLHNTNLKLKRGKKYGLLGGNDCGKTTLMRAITNEQIDGFPPPSELRTVFVEADIQGELSDLSCVDYVFQDPRIQKIGASKESVSQILQSVGFQKGGIREGADPDLPVARLSGGWRMKLALARAMLQNADILLMDEPTNHLDVINVAWVKSYIKSLTNVTCIMVSHDAGLLTDVCDNILSIRDLKLSNFVGNLPAYVEKNPEAKSFFEFKASEKMKFTFPKPSFIEGIKSRGKALMKMTDVTFGYPTSIAPIVKNVKVQVSMASRVACVGVNGAGKSTMVKLLTGELEPQGTKYLNGENQGVVWKHPGARIAYVAQHAFHHIENHLSKTPNEYIKWRYQFGKDKETLAKVTMDFNEEELKLQAAPVEISIKDEATGKVNKSKRIIEKLTGQFRKNKAKENEYETKFDGMSMDSNMWFTEEKLKKWGWAKMVKKIDEEAAQRAGMYIRPLTTPEVEKHLNDLGLAPEFGTHYRISALSGGQKVKVVLAAAMWMQPHIVILDEPTNYLDREALGALAGAIETFEGGVVIISHNNDFCNQLCPETWVMEAGNLNCKGDAEWMKQQDTKVEFKAMEEMTDAAGNTVKLKTKKELSKKELKAKARRRALKIKNGEPLSSDEEEDWN